MVRHKRTTRLAVLLSLALTPHCSTVGGYGGAGSAAGGGQLDGRCTGAFGAGAAAAKLESFLVATADFTTGAAALETAIIEACQDMGSKLGVSDAEMQGGDPQQSKVAATCAPVRAKLDAELSCGRRPASRSLCRRNRRAVRPASTPSPA